MFERDKAWKKKPTKFVLHIHLSWWPTVCVTLFYISIQISMQGACRAWGTHSGLITWISQPIKDISAAPARLKQFSCMFRHVYAGFWNFKKVEMSEITSPDIHSCGGLSRWMQSVVGLLKGRGDHREGKAVFESWHFTTISDKKNNFLCVVTQTVTKI